MTNLSPEARRILGLARRGDDPLEVDRARIDRRMSQRLALAAGATGLALGSAKVASGAAVSTGLALGGAKVASGAALVTLIGKGVAAGVVVTATAFGLWHAAGYVNLRHASTPAQSVTAISPHAESRPMKTRVPAIASGLNDESPSVQEPPRNTSPEIVGVTTTPQTKADRSERERRVNPASSLEPTADPLQNEVVALREAQQAISAGDAQRALALVAEQNRRFAGGALQQERSAARVFALCSLGRKSEARAEAGAFERRWPRSPMIARVRRACDGDTSE